jgi:hypothetical protein
VVSETVHIEEVVVENVTASAEFDVAEIENGASPKAFEKEEREKVIVWRVLVMVIDAVVSTAAK